MVDRILFDLLVVAVFLAMMTVLVAAHEFGHYVFARMFGMGVEEFSIGFGKPVLLTYLRKKYRLPLSTEEKAFLDNPETDADADSSTSVSLASALEGGGAEEPRGTVVEVKGKSYLEETTRFTIRAWPLGGFVRIKGMIPDSASNETRIPGGFYRKSPFARFMTLLAGPLFSVLAGIILLVPYNVVVGQLTPNPKPVIGLLAVGQPAQKAGMKLGDVIIDVNGHPVATFYQVVEEIQATGAKPLTMTVKRADKDIKLTMTPRLISDSPQLGKDLEPTGAVIDAYKIGAGWETIHTNLGLGAAIVNAVSLPWETVEGLGQSFLHPKQLKENVGGPETMVKMTAAATSAGFSQVVLLAAILSISLGIFNLLPFPPLDGGQMVIAIVEMARRGRRLSLKVQGIVFTAGFAVVGMLVMLVLFVDFKNGLDARQAETFKVISSGTISGSQAKAGKGKPGMTTKPGVANTPSQQAIPNAVNKAPTNDGTAPSTFGDPTAKDASGK